MKLSYKKLWVMLVERDMKKTEFAKKAKISSASLAKLGKGANVTTDVLVKICEELNCDISDICEMVPDDAPEEKLKTEPVFSDNAKNRISMDTCDYLEVDSDG